MRRNMSKVISVALTMSLALSMCACSAKSSVDTENTTAEAETEIETETEKETEEETLDASGNDPSSNDVSDNDVSENDAEEETKDGTESESEDSPESKTKSASEEEEEESPEEESTNSKTSEKDSTKSETTTSETTTEAVTVQSVSAVVSGTHYVGETLTGADFTVTVTMSDGSTKTNPAGWSAQPLTLNSTSNLITVAYEGASVTITVNAETVPETTTAATVASNTTTTTTTKAETTQAATTQATTAATTAATTTAAETTTDENDDSVHFICADCDWSYEYAMALFDAQNDLRAELGLPDFIWDDEMYEVAKQCAKACGDAEEIDHALTEPYRHRTVVYDSYGNTVDCLYVENLSEGGCPTNYSDLAWEAANILDGIKNSSGHYARIKAASNIYTAIAAYRKNDRIYISYLFLGDDKVDWWIDY